MCVCVFNPVLKSYVIDPGSTLIMVHGSEFSIKEVAQYIGF